MSRISSFVHIRLDVLKAIALIAATKSGPLGDIRQTDIFASGAEVSMSCRVSSLDIHSNSANSARDSYKIYQMRGHRVYWRLRQICLVAADLDSVLQSLCAIFDLEVSYRSKGNDRLGIRNGLIPVGPTFIEVVAPIRDDSAASRFLQRRKGDGGYMFITDCDDLDRRRAHFAKLALRIIATMDVKEFAPVRGTQIHPKDCGGCILAFDQHELGPDLLAPYYWAGEDWQKSVRTNRVKTILGADLQSADPEGMAKQWSKIVERPVERGPKGEPQINLELGFARFTHDWDGRGEGLSAVYLETVDAAAIYKAAELAQVTSGSGFVEVAGVRWFLS